MARGKAVVLDDRGRITIPEEVRKKKGWGPGTTFFIQEQEGAISLAKAENPFDTMARRAIEDDDAGLTRDLRDYARDRNVRLNGE